VRAIDPGRLLAAAAARGVFDALEGHPVYVMAAGKAAWPMAAAFNAYAVDARLHVPRGVIAGPRAGESAFDGAFEWFAASHPSPNAASEAAGRRALALARESRHGGVLLVLLSGGASSLVAVPADNLLLSDKVAAAQALMNAGVAIADLNCVRKHLSAIKGGRLATAAATTITLAISDVHGPKADDPAVIGSGPTVADPTTFADAIRVVRDAGVASIVPSRVVAHLERAADETPKPGDSRLAAASFEVIGNRRSAMDGAAEEARSRGYVVQIVEAATSGEARDAGLAFAASALRNPAGQPTCVIASGETTVHVHGRGRGGRNQEFVLAAAALVSATGQPARVVALASAGTDGIDGPTDAAGAIVDSTTTDRAGRAGIRIETALASNSAYEFFHTLDDLIMWGPTGTNVGDLHVLLTTPGAVRLRPGGGRHTPDAT
jgi:glycerate-2-kinase